MDGIIRKLFDQRTIRKRTDELALRIRDYYDGEPIHLICILKGAVFFYCDLAQALDRAGVSVTLDFMSVSSYQNRTESSGVVRIVKDLDHNPEGRNVLIVEDIIDSGYTLHYLCDIFKRRLPKRLAVCTLLDKPDRRKVEVPVEFTGFEIEDRFVIGYGLDYAQKYRALPYVGYLEEETASEGEEA